MNVLNLECIPIQNTESNDFEQATYCGWIPDHSRYVGEVTGERVPEELSLVMGQ
ncbi:MAG: hypothetical protein IIB95_01705 [Candidatus Marinimicrobia bacterium]|nr:hypothetical protein [Candidatus Neomarinimicrobiota bacterium]